MTAATPGRDELREQIAAVGKRLAAAYPNKPSTPEMNAGYNAAILDFEDAAASVVDTWVAAHTERADEQVAALRVEVERLAGVLESARTDQDVLMDAARAAMSGVRAAVARVRALCDEADHQDCPQWTSLVRAALDPPTEGRNP